MLKTQEHTNKLRIRLSLILFVFLFASLIGRTQENDTVATVTTDSLSANPMLHEEEDTVAKPEYRYYRDREIWAIDSFQWRQVPDSIINSFKASDAFWYANKDFRQKKEAVDNRPNGFWDWLSRQDWYKSLAWFIIIGGFITVLIWFLMSSNISIFRKRPKLITTAGNVEVTENIFEINYDREIEKATKALDFRLAIRLMYLRLLKHLAEKNIIAYKQGLTNFDYLTQVSGGNYYRPFFRLTRNYEYTWYGEFIVSSEIFSALKSEFESFEKQLH